jgi:threonyl-tRNA synthetase
MSAVTLVVDGQPESRELSEGLTAGDLLGEDRSVVVARVNGELRDLDTPLSDGDEVEPITVDSPEGLFVLRHSAAHVMAQAVQELFPGTRLGIGPPITDGFYYDFDAAEPFQPDDLKRVEKRMVQIIKSGQRFRRRVVTEDEARDELADETYKLRLIGSEGGAR